MLAVMIRVPALIGLVLLAVPVSAAERTYSVTDFDRITVEGPYIVRLVIGRPTTARASGPQASIDRVIIDTQGQTLRIRPNRSAWGGNSGAQQGVLEIALSTRSLRSARVIGPGRLDIEGIEGLRVDLSLEGSGRLTASGLAADNLSLGLLGAGRLEVSGRARSVRADVQGSGDLDAAALSAEDVTATAATSGTVALAASRTARINAHGLGEVTVSGRPSCTVQGLGVAMVRCGDGR
jgi:hypothetical protein